MTSQDRSNTIQYLPTEAIAASEPMASVQDEPLPVIPNVVLGACIGRGGFAQVYRGKHQTLEVDVAVKIVRSNSIDSRSVQRALDEARLIARLDHPNLVRTFDAAMYSHGLYMVLEYMDGGSLALVTDASSEMVLAVAKQALAALQALHDLHVIHRDVKPANLLKRNHDQRIKLADLGIAYRSMNDTFSGADLVGTVQFMAPELLEPQPKFHPRTDLYALGVTLLSLASAQVNARFSHKNLMETIDEIKHGPVLTVRQFRSDLPSNLADVIDWLVQKNPSERPQSVGQVLSKLSAQSASLSSTVTVASLSSSPSGRKVGAWYLGDCVYNSKNWVTFVATHNVTGVAGRWSNVQPTSSMVGRESIIFSAAELISRWSHPGLLPVLDWGLHDGRAFVVTAAHGLTVDELVQASGPMDEMTTLRFALDICRALMFIHGEQYVYQVVEPGAIRVQKDGRSLQLAWSWFVVPAHTPVVKDNDDVQRACVPLYAAPETFFREGTIDPSADIWGLGEVLYLLLCGKSLFTHDQLTALMLAKTKKNPVDLQSLDHVTAPTRMLIRDMLAYAPEARPTAVDIAGRIQRIIAGLDGQTTD